MNVGIPCLGWKGVLGPPLPGPGRGPTGLPINLPAPPPLGLLGGFLTFLLLCLLTRALICEVDSSATACNITSGPRLSIFTTSGMDSMNCSNVAKPNFLYGIESPTMSW